jgi:phosphoribosyl 1,2-cyclic phosphodiesterase
MVHRMRLAIPKPSGYKGGTRAMRVTVLASGSAGNSILIEADRTRLLVDAGPSARELARRLDRSATATRLEDVQAVLVTHEHSDHVGGASALSSAGLALFATAGTARAARLTRSRPIAAGEPFEVGALAVTPVALPHDAAEPVGFVLSDGEARVGILTDCGHPDPAVAAAFAGCDVLVLETNHDPDMLRAGGYPPTLKRRIGGRRGHLSNEQAAELLRLMGRPAPRAIVLAHLSQMNNRPRLARLAVERALAALGERPRLLVASQGRPTAPVACEAGGIRVLPAEDDRQLALAFPD